MRKEWLRDLARPPAFADAESTRAATMYYRLTWGILPLFCAALFLMCFVDRNLSRWLFFLCAIAVTCAVGLFLNARGRTRQAVWLLLVVLFGLMCGAGWTGGGVQSFAVNLFPLLVLMAGLLLGVRTATAVAVVCALTGLAFALVEHWGWLPPNMVLHSPLTFWIALLLRLGLFLLVLVIAVGGLQRTLAAARNELRMRTQAEDELRESHRHYRLLVDHARDGIFTLGSRGQFLFVNEGLCRMLGYAADELLRLNILDTYPDEERAVAQARLASIERGQSMQFERRMKRKDGTFISIEASAWKTQKDEQEAIVRDVTTRKQAEAALRASEEKYRELVQNANSIIIRMDKNGVLTFANEFAERFFGYRQEDLIGRNVVGTIVPETDSGGRDLRALVDDIARRPNHYANNENENMRRNGERVWIAWTNKPLLDSEGRVDEILCVGNDITEYKRAQDALRASEEKLNALFSSMAEMVAVHELVFDDAGTPVNYRITDCNTAFTTVTGIPREAAVGRLATEAYAVAEPPYLEEYTRTALTGEPQVFETYFAPMGRHFSISVVSPGKNRFATIATDITERQRAEAEREELQAQLRQAQKMEAVGRLAGGVAHDFNNILQVILAHTEILQEKHAPESPSRRLLDDMHAAAQRAADLTRQLLAFSRRQAIQPVNLDLNALVEEVSKMVRRLIGEHIELKCVLAGALDFVFADKSQVMQVLLNLCVNARDAMPRGGTLTLATRNAVLNEAFCRSHSCADPGRYVIVSVTDTGQGMDAETLAHMFDPFFTTKGVGEGTGLGLATAYGIVQQHRGLIDVSSRPEAGTEFRVYLPAVDRPAALTEATPAPPVGGGKETILVAEDEPAVLNLVSAILREAGYTVLPAVNGIDALRVYEEHSSAVDLILLDVIMPGLTGRQVMDELHSRNPQTAFLFCSGYSETVIPAEFAIDKGLRLIHKPYRKDELLREVRQALDERPSGG